MPARLVAPPLCSFLLVSANAFAADPCLDCLSQSQEELRLCLQQAISVEDKLACEDRQEERAKRCDNDTCRLERELSGQDQPPPSKVP